MSDDELKLPCDWCGWPEVDEYPGKLILCQLCANVYAPDGETQQYIARVVNRAMNTVLERIKKLEKEVKKQSQK